MPVALGLVDIGVLLALVVLIGLRFGYSYTLGRVLIMTAALLNTVSIPTPFGNIHLLGFAADALLKADHAIMHALGRGISDLEGVWNESVSYMATAVHWIGKEIASLSHDTSQAIETLTTRDVPKWVRKRLAAALAGIAALKAYLLHVRHAALPRIERITHVVTHRVTVVEHAIAHPDIGTLPRTLPKVGQLEREIADALARGKELLRRFGPTALLGTIAFALGRLGITWARCSNVNKVGKRACGMNPDLLESLLADTLLVAGTLSLVEFARGMQDVTAEVTPLIRTFWRAT